MSADLTMGDGNAKRNGGDPVAGGTALKRDPLGGLVVLHGRARQGLVR